MKFFLLWLLPSLPGSVAGDDLQLDADDNSVTSVHYQVSATSLLSAPPSVPQMLIGASHRAPVLPSRHHALEDRLSALKAMVSQVSAERSALEATQT